MKKYRRTETYWVKVGIPIAVIVIFVSLLLVGHFHDTNEFEQQSDITADPYLEVLPFEEEQILVGDVVAEWLKGEHTGEELYNKYSAAGRVYTAKSVVINYAIYDIPASVEVESQLVELSENSSFEKSTLFELPKNKRSIRFDYLFTDKTYYYRITAKLSDGSSIYTNGSFKTADTPRIISAEGVWNMRDIGGVDTVYGKKMKQGLVYRGVELDGAVYEKYCITENGAKVLTEQLGIRTEIDLRAHNDRIRDALGPGVNHTIYGVYAYADSLVPYYLEDYRKLFSDLAKEENYPLYVHCSYGKDRTGTVCYLLQILLGVSEEDAFKEWEMSVLLDGVIDYIPMQEYIKLLKQLDGDTMQEKVENHLLSIGVTKEEIENIREILIEDYVRADSVE